MTRENNEERKTKSLVYIINYKVTVYKLENFIDTFDFIICESTKYFQSVWCQWSVVAVSSSSLSSGRESSGSGSDDDGGGGSDGGKMRLHSTTSAHMIKASSNVFSKGAMREIRLDGIG